MLHVCFQSHHRVLVTSLFVTLLAASDVFTQFRWERKTTLDGAFSSFAAAVAINPLNPNTIYGGGTIFAVSRDRGEKWQYLPLPAEATDVRMIVVHPVDTNTVFIGGSARGVWKSINSGQSWRKVLEGVNFNGRAIVVDPFHPDTLHLGSFGEGFYSSYDRGDSWFLVSDYVGSFCSMAIRPDSSNVLIGGAYFAGQIVKSRDYGRNWRTVAARRSNEIPLVTFDPVNPDNVYAAVFGSLRDEYGVVKSTNGGETWQPAGSDLFNLEIWGLAVNPADPNVLFAGGFFDTSGRIFYSADAGQSWCAIRSGLPADADAWMLEVSQQNEVYAAMNVRSSGGALFKLVAGEFGLDPPENLLAREPGTGTTAIVEWQPPSTCHAPIAKYIVHYGTMSRVYDDSVDAGTATGVVVSNLQEGVLHYLTVVAIDTAGRRSPPAREITFTPTSIPSAPRSLAARYGLFEARLSWLRNLDLDLAGYNVYRSAAPTTGFQKLNSVLLVDTVYTDIDLPSGRFFYKITAVDLTGLESADSNLLPFRPITLERSLLLIDQTRDGSGSIAFPSDVQVDEFYRRLLAGFDFSEYDVRSTGLPGDTLGLYSMILWYHDDALASSAPGSQAFMADYLDAGGKLLFSGWNLMAAFTGGTSPRAFAAGEFAYDYLQIDTTWRATEVQFTGAKAVAPDYHDLRLDSLKVPVSAWNGLLREVHVFAPRAGVKVLFNYAAPDPAYIFDGRTIGFVSSRHQVAVLGIPFYLMQEAEAAAALRTILIKEFDLTPISVEERGSLAGMPSAFALLPNYPNPFVESTQIRFIMPQAGRVKIEVFDLLGKQVATVVESAFEAGRHETTLRPMLECNGVYFYRMTVTQGSRVVHQQTQKLLVLR